MMVYQIIKFAILNIILVLRYFAVDAEAPDFCLAQLNTSDCGRHASPVFYYHKPGSTCKMTNWRGCPSQNMFHSESQCTKVCSEGKKPIAEGPGGLKSMPQFGRVHLEVEIEEEKSILCSMIWNSRNCSKPPKEVYTYDIKKKACVKTNWYGCPTLNKFDDQKSCVKACLEYQQDWKARMEKLNTYLIKGIEAEAIDLVRATRSINYDVDNDNRIHNGTADLDTFWLAVKENLPLDRMDHNQLQTLHGKSFGKRDKRVH